MAFMSTRMSAEMTLVTALTKPDVVDALEADAHLEFGRSFARPVGLHDAVGVTRQQVGRVGAATTVDLDAAADRDEAKDVVPGNGVQHAARW